MQKVMSLSMTCRCVVRGCEDGRAQKLFRTLLFQLAVLRDLCDECVVE